MIDPVNESATKAAYSVPPTDARTCVSAGDVNLDGFTDIVSINDLYMRLYISNATSGNEQVDLKRVIPDVSGSTMCGGTNQSFFIEPPMTGYTDLESNIVRALFRCDLAGNLSNTSWTPYGTDFTLPCYYGVNSTGSHIAMICMQDIVHASDLSQCVNIETIVSNGELCVSPDLIFSEDNAVTDIEEGDADGDGIPDSEDSATLKEKLEGIFSLMDADDEDSRLIVCIAIIVVTMLGFIAMSHGHTLASLVAGFACGMIELITFTLLGWVTPFILVALVIVLVAVGFIVIPLVRGSGG